MYNEEGETTWQRSLDSNGAVKHGDNSSCPFLYQGQYYDEEIELAYNRFRYYSPDSGTYISQDPIGLASGEFGLYNYVEDSNDWVDVFGLAKKKGSCGSYSTVGGHHVHAKAGFKNNPKYSLYKAFCLGNDWMKKNGINHADVTRSQRKQFKKLAEEVNEGTKKNTLKEHTKIAKQALIDGGATPELADKLAQKSLNNLAKQNVTNPSNIPWYL